VTQVFIALTSYFPISGKDPGKRHIDVLLKWAEAVPVGPSPTLLLKINFWGSFKRFPACLL
jgi:hypothetical protein